MFSLPVDFEPQCAAVHPGQTEVAVGGKMVLAYLHVALLLLLLLLLFRIFYLFFITSRQPPRYFWFMWMLSVEITANVSSNLLLLIFELHTSKHQESSISPVLLLTSKA